MWIRSQDKKRLVKVECGFDLTPSGLSIFAIGLNGILGEYSTKEKVLKVLDMMQKHLTVIEEWHIASRLIIRAPQNDIKIDLSSYVFTMPQDSEVN